ncbi:DUF6007 family protein [Staphylococcus ratti]|uniref:DUF6007 family protein n=1 Tax=Staphylococcus ratti TaxID=2892440 RepID=A0ABY3PF77_9STAP|nr:DUF6007 family protein [Staphylococcus ratti]UEX90853.1 DUF6007 family protein [Staphylococcus ratti]
MTSPQHDDFDKVFKEIGWYDLILLIPSALLVAYLPDDFPGAIVINLLIVIFWSIGLITTVHWCIQKYKERKSKR